jgi:hypothetical protein
MPVASKNKKAEIVTVTPPNIQAIAVRLVGNAPFMQARFSEKAMLAMQHKMDGTTKKGSKNAREARDFQADYEAAMHISEEGWAGIPCSGLRAAMISACRLVNFTMTRAKLSIFIPAEGFDRVDAQPLFRIYGEPEINIAPVRNATGVFDLRARPLWKKWHSDVTIQFDEDQFDVQAVLNLIRRVGLQVGLGEGRPDSRNSAGLGYGTFDVEPIEN